jgi:hypothetical protein
VVFIFYKVATGVQAWMSFSKEFKHCNAIVYDGTDWLMIDFDRTGFLMRKVKCKDGKSLLRNLPVVQDISAIISVSVKARAKVRWKPFLVRSCNEVCRYAAGVDIGFTFNPIHLYRKLLKYNHKRNYEVLSAWRREHGISRRRQRAEQGRAIS